MLSRSCFVLAACALLAINPAQAEEPRATEAEAQAMVGKAVALLKARGPDVAYKSFTEHPDGAFKDRDLYVFVYDFGGTCLAQGANPKMVGKNLLAITDVDGKAFIKGMVTMVQSSGKGWYGPYKFARPDGKGYEEKKSYCERGVGDTMVCAGIYVAAK
ncbi:cache domain-containing protein [Paucibacter oligotrophus]|uniref:Cache domain-containing protein n=1 Tax=Roseateles oligotrophus TaxID=1769250 RepID=A0ABT2YD27_9BURK|nr:cache domain-containing protein [Roseateles oligotrophus]